MRTIEQLNTLLEELEKRIKNISTAQNTITQLQAILTCMSDVQDYLKELNHAFDSHVQECDDYTQEINNLQNQIDLITKQLNDLNYDDETIAQIKADLSELQARLSNFIGNSHATAETLENDLSELQTELALTQEDLSSLQADISSANQTIGEHTTTITNLQTTQTNLQTTQSNQASTISSIDNRLTTCENNVSTLTGGVDVGEIDNRISILESNLGAPCAHEEYKFSEATPYNYTFFTREYFYSCAKQTPVYQVLKIKYSNVSATTLTIKIYEEMVETGESYTVDLTKNPNEYQIVKQFVASKCANNIMLCFVADNAITYTTFDMWILGNNITLYNYNQDLKVACFENNIYLTRLYDDCVKYGKFSATDTIDIDNLPNQLPYHDDEGRCFKYYYFSPFLDTNSYALKYNKIIDNCFFRENAYNLITGLLRFKDDGSLFIFNTTLNSMAGGEVVSTHYRYALNFHIRNSKPQATSLNYGGHTELFKNTNIISGEWLYVAGLQNNHNTFDAGGELHENLQAVALNEDGCFYFFNKREITQAIKICKGGNFATAYKQQDGSINVYVSNGLSTSKYILTLVDENLKTYSCVFEQTFDDCLAYYETINNNVLKKTKSGWVLQTL